VKLAARSPDAPGARPDASRKQERRPPAERSQRMTALVPAGAAVAPVRGKRSVALQVGEYPAAPKRPVVGWFPDVREARCGTLNTKLTRVRWLIGERSTVSSWRADRDQRPGVCRAASAPIPTVAFARMNHG